MLVHSPAAARADWLLTPGLGTTFGADTNGNEHFTYGASLGWMGAGIMGWEADFSYTPEFFEGSDGDFEFTGDSNVVTAMANAIIGVPVGGQTGGGVRPYFAAGLGLLQREVSSDDALFTINNNEFDLGVGNFDFWKATAGVTFRW